MNVYVLDGTYELFRHYYALPSVKDSQGREVGALRGVIGSVLRMLEDNVTHIGVATDRTVESFRNKLWPGYKTSEDIEPNLLQQFHPLEDALEALGINVWPMIECEADDALATAAKIAVRDKRVEKVFICTPDKDLAQCVKAPKVVQFDRRNRTVYDDNGIRSRFGVEPESITDYLALVGDKADGYPGILGWGEKSTATILARYRHIEHIPRESSHWDVPVRGSVRLAKLLRENKDKALLFRSLATLRTDLELFGSVDELEWKGPTAIFFDFCAQINAPGYFRRATALAKKFSVLGA